MIIGESFSDGKGNKPYLEQDAITSTFANTPTDNEMYEEYNFPQVVDNLSENPRKPVPSKLEPVEEVPTTHEFYDGTLNLNKVKVNCIIHTSIADCVGENGCGWCNSEGGCIFGTKFGPLQPCVASSYIGGLRYPNINNQLKYVNEPVGQVTKYNIWNDGK